MFDYIQFSKFHTHTTGMTHFLEVVLQCDNCIEMELRLIYKIICEDSHSKQSEIVLTFVSLRVYRIGKGFKKEWTVISPIGLQ